MVSVQRHLALLRGELRAGEVERAWLRAERIPQGHAGALVVTDRRVLFSGLGVLQQSQEAWPLAIARAGAAAEPGVLTLAVPGGAERFRMRPSDADRARSLLGSDAGAPAGLVDELGRLAALRERGALSPDEFEAAERRLLG